MVVSVLPLIGRQDKTPSSGAGDAFHRRHPVGRVLSAAAEGPARASLRSRWLGCGVLAVCMVATTLGYGLAANLPALFAAAILLLTPLAFLLSTARNCRQISDILALVLGLALFPLVSMLHTGVISRSAASRGQHCLWRALVAGESARMSGFFGSPHALLVLVVAGFLPNEVWRMAGLWFGAGVDEGSEILAWVRAVGRDPGRRHRANPDAAAGGAGRCPGLAALGAVAAGLLVFMLTRRSILPAWLAANRLLGGNGGSVDCRGPIIRYCPAHKKRSRKRNEVAEQYRPWTAPRLRRAAAHAAEYPIRPIKLVVPYAAGGATNVLAAWSANI